MRPFLIARSPQRLRESNRAAGAIGHARAALAAIAGLAFATTAYAGAVCVPDDCLPPPDGVYAGQFHAQFPVLGMSLGDPVYSGFTNCDLPPPPIQGASTTHTFQSSVLVNLSIGNGQPQPVQAPAVVTVRTTFNRLDGATRIYDTEMLALDISGGSLPQGVRIRESPALASSGTTTLRSVGPGGGCIVASFFDVHVEMSADGGQTWEPAEGPPGRMMLVAPACPVPGFGGPGLLVLASLLIAGASLTITRRRA
jgi:hypothetical protein